MVTRSSSADSPNSIWPPAAIVNFVAWNFILIWLLPWARYAVLRRSTKLSSVNSSLLSDLAEFVSVPSAAVSAEPQADTRTPPASAAAIATPTRAWRVLDFSWIVFWKSAAAKGCDQDLRKTVMCLAPESYPASSLRKRARVRYSTVTEN